MSDNEGRGAPSTEPLSVVNFEDVSFGYGEDRVLESVSFEILQGDFAAIIGPNGGGKTTILKLILGLLIPDEGRIRLFDSPSEEARKRVGYVPQYTLFDPLFPATVEDVVLMGRLGAKSRLGFFRREDRRIAASALKTVGLEGLEKRPFPALSGGQRQRVLIARALASEADLLILDEPTSNVDRTAEKEIYTLLGSLKGEKTILLVSHDTAVVSNLADTILCINRTLARHPGCELTGEDLGKLYGDDMKLVLHDIHNEASAASAKEDSTC
ncbi:metal ABC transporter ATP-binding protein [Sediminispirochaeta smaragdinae]|uniref:ABC transporter related protein n=1 Tax=Sediminispirochaeta smaragdinae (strain DSM 11293 / JCM 15392 / SEBR 4228) TaxID=573413 RepID=E1RA61_SEDSS|nr:ABC transporter ATP-binding protein [Sediminispirochaeta smaragdinae]ADK79352.1 ABC transporter related protein [Sediminispirochaeta smaragdinae DSM 11293]